MPITCDSSTRTTVLADGSKTVVTTLAKVVTINPESNFSVEMCGYKIGGTSVFGPQPCPTGATCTTTGTPPPTPTTVCQWVSGGIFYDGKLVVGCGTTVTTYNSGGTQTGQTITSYDSATLHTW